MRLTPGEVAEYVHGANKNQEQQERTMKSGRQTRPSADQRRREEEALQKYA